jgi:hypothetical protein
MRAPWMELCTLWMTWATLAWGKHANMSQPGCSWKRTYFRTGASAQLTKCTTEYLNEVFRAQGSTSRCIHLKSKLLIGSWDLSISGDYLSSSLYLFAVMLCLVKGQTFYPSYNEALPWFVARQHQDVMILLPKPILNLLPCWFFLSQSATWALVGLQHFWHNTVTLKFLWTVNLLFAVVGCIGGCSTPCGCNLCPHSCKLVKLVLDIDILFRSVQTNNDQC